MAGQLLQTSNSPGCKKEQALERNVADSEQPLCHFSVVLVFLGGRWLMLTCFAPDTQMHITKSHFSEEVTSF